MRTLQPLEWSTLSTDRSLDRWGDTSSVDRLREEFASTHVREVMHRGVLNRAGMSGPMSLYFNDCTYELSDDPEDNWLHQAWSGFLGLKVTLGYERNNHRRQIGTFATIGTGPGLDAVLAAAILEPRRVVMTDIQPSAVAIARENFANNARHPKGHDPIEFCALEGSLCEPLRKHDIKPEVLYMNLPNIPGGDIDSVLEGMRSSTFIPEQLTEGVPNIYQQYLLSMQYVALCDAANTIEPSGSIVLNLGGRVPEEIVKNLFEDCGLRCSELGTGFKRQTQPEEVLPGYAKAETLEGVEFDFYDYDRARPMIPDCETDKPYFVQEWKELLASARITSKQALKHWENGGQVGHLVQMLRGTKCSD